ncbi:hypothetical protein JIP32914_240019 [Tenacibaculum maritimum]|uniref:hypothetical protein n=1 Tax=Tenacibaculum maritimum TaxID=107401 RepID=UPI0012E621B8|nr:hypothetical protein [Tenacibaculum maritimum]CAA0201416.1 hypothetical protein JIP32914_240019 [Tenacibaculum maritimum]
MIYGKIHTYSIIMVRYEHGGTQWLRTKKGRSIDKIVSWFSKLPHYKWLKVFEFEKGKVGKKYFYHTSTGSYGFN